MTNDVNRTKKKLNLLCSEQFPVTMLIKDLLESIGIVYEEEMAENLKQKYLTHIKEFSPEELIQGEIKFY